MWLKREKHLKIFLIAQLKEMKNNRRTAFTLGNKFTLSVALLAIGGPEVTPAPTIVTPNVFHYHRDAIGALSKCGEKVIIGDLRSRAFTVFFILAVKGFYFLKPVVSIHISLKNVDQKLLKEI